MRTALSVSYTHLDVYKRQGGTVGYKVAIKKTLSQKQSAGDGSEQRQELQIGKNDGGINSSKSKINLKQSQKAGNGSIQTQIGGINDDRR